MMSGFEVTSIFLASCQAYSVHLGDQWSVLID